MTSEFGGDDAPGLLRFRYSKVSRGCLHFVIVDKLADGTLEFWSQESGDVRWFPFAPSAEEREVVLASWDAKAGNRGWPLLLT